MSRRSENRGAPRIPARAVKAATKGEPRVRERRDRLIAASIEVFKKKGFHLATMREIGRAAEMTQGTIYNYVESKDDILYLVCDRLVERSQSETRKALETVADPVQRVSAAARAVAEVIYDHQDEILLIYQNTHLLDRRSLRVILARVDGFVRMFEKLIADAAREARVETLNTYLAAHILTFLPTMIALRRWAIEREVSRTETVRGIADFLTRGLGFSPTAAPR